MPRGTPLRLGPAELDWLREHRAGLGDKALAAAFAARFGQPCKPGTLAKACRRAGIRQRTGRGHWTKGMTPWNKGLKGQPTGYSETRFKRGQRPHSWVPVGSYAMGLDGYWKVKVSDHGGNGVPGDSRHDWRMAHSLVYETEVGPIPPGHVVILIDSDPEHCLDAGNLACVSRAELARLNETGFGRLPPDRALRLAAIAQARVRAAAHAAAHRAGLTLYQRRKLFKAGAGLPALEAGASAGEPAPTRASPC